MGTSAKQKKLFFNLRKTRSKISVLQEGDMRSNQVKLIAEQLGVTEPDVIDMNRWLGGRFSQKTRVSQPSSECRDSGHHE